MVLDPALAAAWQQCLPLARPLELIAVGTDVQVVLAQTSDHTVVVKCLRSRRGRRGHARRELAALEAAQGPHVVRLLGVARTDEVTFVVMERLGRRTLRDLVGQPWTAVDLVAAGLGVSRALARVHTQDLMFNDFKPRNVGLADVGAQFIPKLIDFGHARTVADTRANRFIGGSLDYAPPELVREGQLGTWSDVWAWGRSWHLLATGEYFGRVSSINQLFLDGRMPMPPLGQVSRMPLPASLARLIDDCLALDASQRPRDAGDLHERLLELATTEWGGVEGLRGTARFVVE